MNSLHSLPIISGWRQFFVFCVFAISAVLSRGDESPVVTIRSTYRIRGLFCPEREEELRVLWKAELPDIKVLKVDSLLGEATFEFDPVIALGPAAKAAPPETLLAAFNQKVLEASRRQYPGYPIWESVFTLVPHTPPETLQHVEMSIEGLDCKACALGFHEMLVKLPGVQHAQVSFRDGRAIVLVDPIRFDELAVRLALAEQSTSATLYEMSSGVRRERNIEGVWRRRPAISVGGSPDLEKRSEPEQHRTRASAEGFRFVLVSGGTYERGNASRDNDYGWSPVQKVTLGGYSMAVNLTTKAQWDAVRSWALKHGYTDLAAGDGRAGDHPVQSVNWHDVVKWCNAASEKDGLTPCYEIGGDILRQGTPDEVTCAWHADGYRLPTEAEWEVAARGGLVGKRFPWGDTISHDQANYRCGSEAEMPFDKSGKVAGFHSRFAAIGEVCTSPVGSFPANGYGLFDMAGNVSQWCWDLWGHYGTEADPRGPNIGALRVVRGGSWAGNALRAASAIRVVAFPSQATTNIGFRLARRQPGQTEVRSGP